jgi:AcrR family transcriptional regulator
MARPKQEHDESKVALLDAARRLLASGGPTALTVRQLAADAGLSTMAIYSRYGGKDGIVNALYVEGFERLAAAMNDAGMTDDPMVDLDRSGRAYRRFALDHPTSYAVMFQNVVPDFQPSDDALVVAAGTLDLLAQLVRRAIDAGRIAPDDPQMLAALLWASQHGIVSLELGHSAPPWIDFAALQDRAHVALMRGLASDSSSVTDGSPAPR